MVFCTAIMVLEQLLCSNDGKAWARGTIQKHWYFGDCFRIGSALISSLCFWDYPSTARFCCTHLVQYTACGSLLWETQDYSNFLFLFNRHFLLVSLCTLFCLTTSSHTVFTSTLKWTLQMLSYINSYFDSGLSQDRNCLSPCSKPISDGHARSSKKGNEVFCQLWATNQSSRIKMFLSNHLKSR